MDLQPFLAFSCGSFALAMIFVSVMTGSYRFPGIVSFLAVHALTLLVAATGYFWFPESVGYASALCLFLALAPSIAMNRANRESMAAKPQAAARYARLAFFLHPFPNARAFAARAAALARPTREERIEALSALAARLPADQRLAAQCQLLAERRDWQGILALLGPTPRPAWQAPLLVRALGETGNLEAMVSAYRQIADLPPDIASLTSTLHVLAFGGHVQGVSRLWESSLAIMPPLYRQVWTAAALQAAGRADEAEQLLRSLKRAGLGQREQDIIDDRLARPAAPAASRLGIGALSDLTMIEASLLHAAPRRRGVLAAPLTLILVAANIAMFGIEALQGGSQNVDTLVALGAVWPDAIIQDHAYWRLFAALFLHAGPEHLIGNMLALWLLGRMVEALAGPLRMAGIYFIGGLASMAGTIWLAAHGWSNADVLVGASGAIFALVGAIALRRLREYTMTRSVQARRNLILIGFVIVLEAAIDLAVPEISFSAHAIGFIAGIVLGVVLLPKRRRG